MPKKKETLRERNARIRRQNVAFERLSPAKKRVFIAKDVLAQIDLNRIQAVSGVYFESETLNDIVDDVRFEGKSASKQLQTIFRKVETCTACALGSMFLCGVETANKLKLNQTDIVDNRGVVSDDIYTYLSRFFDMRQLVVIESAFEQRNMFAEHRDHSERFDNLTYEEVEEITDEVADAIDFGLIESDATTRLQLIMRNIVANKGTFVPLDVPHRGWITPNYNG